MKRISMFLFLLIALSSSICFAQNAWTKIDIQTGENLQKVIILGTKTLIFSNSNCYIGTNLSNWENVNIPDSYNICPVIFKEYIYINCKDGIYKSLNGKNWERSSLLPALSLSANLKKIFAFTNNQSHLAFESNNGIEFTENTGIKNIYPPSSDKNAWLFSPNFTFTEAFGDTIYASGLTSSGPSEVNCHSFDNGVTWISESSNERISDIELDNYYGLIKTARDHGGPFFIVHGSDFELKMMGGAFLSLKKFEHKFYYGGITYNSVKNGGILMLKGDIGNIFYTPEPINRLESNQYYMIAIGDNGTVYVTKNDFTDYALSSTASSTIESSLTDVQMEIMDIFPNPASNSLNIKATPGEEIKIIDLNGKTVKSLFASEEKTVISINDLANNIYIVKSGNKVAKLIKQ